MLCLFDRMYILFQMKKLYNWHDVAKRTEIVYERALKCSNQSLLERLSRYVTLKFWLIKLCNKLFCTFK